MYPIVLLTAVTVSLDALTAGVALASFRSITQKDTVTVGLITLLLCTVAQWLGRLLAHAPVLAVNLLGGALLACVGIRNLFPPTRAPALMPSSATHDAALVGVAAGLDGALATFSLVCMGYGHALTPLMFGAMHALAVGVGGVLTASLKKFPTVLAASILILLGGWKIASAFM